MEEGNLGEQKEKKETDFYGVLAPSFAEASNPVDGY